MTHEERIAFRMADANFNRVMEGIRTLEDIARFHDFAELQGTYKALRHRLTRAMTSIDSEERLAARDAARDVGRDVKMPAELDRSNGLADIAAAASGRAEQGMRVLEEVGKFISPQHASEFESVRYRLYDVNAALQLALARDVAFLARAKLYVLVDCQLPLAEFESRVRAIASAGCPLIQIRDKTVDAVQQIAYAETAAKVVDPLQTRILMNDRVDLAVISRAWGVHLGQEDVPATAARSMLAPRQVIGLSTHSPAQVLSALALPVDYLGCGPTFTSKTKAFADFPGIPFLEQAAQLLRERNSSLPAFAIGGIDTRNVKQVKEAGFERIAVSSSVWNADDPAKATEILLSVLES